MPIVPVPIFTVPIFTVLQIMGDVPEVQLGWVLATPARQPGADRLGVLEARNVMTGVAAVLGDCLAAHVEQFFLSADRLHQLGFRAL